MNAPYNHRLPALIESAAQRMKLAARTAVERTVESLGLAALSTSNIFQRDALLEAQFELNRKSAMFALAFNDCLDERLGRECQPHAREALPTAWDAMGLVDDQEVERKITADRFGLEIAHACEWELRELDGYMGSLLGSPQARNPLKPEVVGMAMLKGIESISERTDVRALLQSELGRVLGLEMGGTYAAIIADMRNAGVQPAGLSVRSTLDSHRHVSGYGGLRDAPDTGQPAPRSGPPSGYASQHGQTSQHDHAGRPSHWASSGGPLSGHGRFGPSARAGLRQAGRRASLGQVDAHMMSLIRRLTHVNSGIGEQASGWDAGAMHSGHGGHGPSSGHGDTGGYSTSQPPPNIIRAHRDELRQAATGSMDHMVIDLIGSLFDQILSDPKVPPQMARQIARLQLPVLRAALGDASFFSSRKHPVRRFVNRIASLAAGFEDLADDEGRQFLNHVRKLVDGIVDGDFDQVELYEQQLAELERLTAELARAEVQAQGDPAAVLGAKETEVRLGQRYAQMLEAELQGLAGHDFVREFLVGIWSRVLVLAAQRDGDQSERFQRLRTVARDLYMSVQPKGTPLQRKEFLASLPRLMQGLTEGMELVGWPDPARKAFFGQLLPAHAESLKAPQSMSTLDWNLLARRVDGAFQAPLPKKADLPPPDSEPPVLNDAIDLPRFSPEEAARIGLVEDSRIDWATPVDIDLSAEPPLSANDIRIAGLPTPEPIEPTEGRSLADHVELGYPYQMHVDGDWQKVKLSHVSPGRTFFVFSRGKRHKQTISLTHRMLAKLCDGGRFRAFESAYLLERATARARRQLSSMGAAI
jgi:hypothetical protein